jgi:hypothetical protein
MIFWIESLLGFWKEIDRYYTLSGYTIIYYQHKKTKKIKEFMQ